MVKFKNFLFSSQKHNFACLLNQFRCLLWFNHTTVPVLSKVNNTNYLSKTFKFFNDFIQITDLDPIWPSYWDWGRNNGIYGPLLATCPVPQELAGHIPTAVSIQSTGDCAKIKTEPTNVLRMINNRTPPLTKRNKNETPAKNMSIGICVKAMRFGKLG